MIAPLGAEKGPRDVVETTVVDGGLTIVTEHMPDVRSVSLGFWVGTGSVDEPESTAGASHFLEHLLFKGTEQRTARQIAELVDAVGGDMNAFTTKEHTAFYVRLLAGSVDLGLDILSEIIWSPALRPEELEAERQVILEEILMHSDEPAEEVHDLFNSAMYPGHPLGRDVLGLEATVSAATRDEIAAFHRRHYRTGNVIVTAAGLIDHSTIVDGVVTRLDKAATEIGREVLSGGGRPERRPPQARAAAPGREPPHRAGARDGGHARVRPQPPRPPGPQRLGPHPGRRDVEPALPDRAGGTGAGLQRVLLPHGLPGRRRLRRLRRYGAGPGQRSAQAPHRGAGQDGGPGPSESELTAARSHIRGATALGLEDSGARMSRLGRSQLAQGRVPSLVELDEEIAAVTVDDLARVAAQVLGGPRSLVVLGPFDEDAFAEWGEPA